MTGTFIDTIIICTLTGLTLIVTNVWTGDLNGAALTQAAFTMGFPVWGKYLLMVAWYCLLSPPFLAGITTANAARYLLGVKAILPYRIIFIGLIACGAFLKLEAIWILADIVNGLMALPEPDRTLGSDWRYRSRNQVVYEPFG